jgi:hypothetical protein
MFDDAKAVDTVEQRMPKALQKALCGAGNPQSQQLKHAMQKTPALLSTMTW